MTRHVPSQLDIDNADARARIAARFRSEYEEARSLAEGAFGPGWVPTGMHHLVDHDEAARCRQSGKRPTPAATVYSAVKDGVKRHFVVTDATPTEVLDYAEGFGPMLTEPHPTERFEVNGEQAAPHRYGLYWAGFEPDYRPKSADELAAMRERRRERAVEKEAVASPLFADLIRAEGYVPRRKSPTR